MHIRKGAFSFQLNQPWKHNSLCLWLPRIGRLITQNPSAVSMHYERAPRFKRSKLDMAASATGWSEPIPGRELHPLESTLTIWCLPKRIALLCR